MKSVMSRQAFGRRVASAAVLGLAATTLSLGVAGPASAANTIELQGTLTGAGGTPLVDADVRAFDASTGDEITSVQTDAAGYYHFDSLPAGPVKVRFTADNPTTTLNSPLPYQQRWSGGSRYIKGATVTSIVVDPAVAPTLNASLPLYAAITGNITVADGRVATGEAGTYAIDSDGDPAVWDEAYDGATGNYRMIVDPGSAVRVSAGGYDNPPVGDDVYYLVQYWKNADTFDTATPISVAPGQTVTGINFRLTTSLTTRQAPSIIGVPTIGRALTANPGTWTRNAGTEFSYSWLRGATVVGTGSSYVPTVADFGQKLTLVVTALNGEFTGQAATVTSDVVRYPADAKGKAKAQSGRKVRFGVKIVSAKQSPVKGKVVVMRGTKVVHKAVKLVKGKAVIVVKGQPKGKQTYTVLYKGNSTLSIATKTFTVRVHS